MKNIFIYLLLACGVSSHVRSAYSAGFDVVEYDSLTGYSTVVTNVTFDGLATTGDVAAVERKIVEAPGVTNIASKVVTDALDKALVSKRDLLDLNVYTAEEKATTGEIKPSGDLLATTSQVESVRAQIPTDTVTALGATNIARSVALNELRPYVKTDEAILVSGNQNKTGSITFTEDDGSVNEYTIVDNYGVLVRSDLSGKSTELVPSGLRDERGVEYSLPAKTQNDTLAAVSDIKSSEWIISKKPTYYCSGLDKESGASGYAYTAVSGDGRKRLAGLLPKVDGRIVLSPVDTGERNPWLDAISSKNFSLSDGCSKEVTSVSDGSYDESGLFYNATYRFTVKPVYDPNLGGALNLFPATLVLSKYSYYDHASIDSVTVGSPDYVYTDGGELYIYSVSVSGTTVSYWWELYDWNTGNYESGSASFTVSVEDVSGYETYEMCIFGDLGAYALESDIAPAIEEYQRAHGMKKETLVERTGQRGEFGSGWGYVVHDLSSDFRTWRIIAPNVSGALGSWGYWDPYYKRYITWSGTTTGFGRAPGAVAINGLYGYVNPLRFASADMRRELVSTSGKYSSDRCTTSVLRFGFYPPIPGDEISVPRVSVLLDSVNGQGIGNLMFSVRSPMSDFVIEKKGVTWEGVLYDHVYTLSGFRFEDMGSGRSMSRTVRLYYTARADVYVAATGALANSFENTHYQEFTFTTANNSFLEYKPVYYALATSESKKLFWDAGLGCTWKLDVTNGCFFAEIVSKKNLTIEDGAQK